MRIKRTILELKHEPIQNKRKYFVIFISTMIGLVSSLTYAHFGAEFGGITKDQFHGFIFATASSVLLLVAGIVGLLYFARNDVTYRIPLRMLLFMMVQLLLAFIGMVYFNIQPNPSKDDIKSYAITHETGVYIRGLLNLEEEMKCCGIDSYEDYKYVVNGEISWEVPTSCCNYQDKTLAQSNCAYPQRLSNSPPDYRTGCFSNIGQFSQLEELAPSFYRIYNVCRLLIIGLFGASLMFTFTLYAYFNLLYKRHKLYANNAKSQMNEGQVPNGAGPGPSFSRGPIHSDSIEVANEIPPAMPITNGNTNNLNYNNNNNVDLKFAADYVNVNVEIPRSTKIQRQQQQIDYDKVKEISMDQLPGSLSQLSAYIYPTTDSPSQIGNLIRPNINKFI